MIRSLEDQSITVIILLIIDIGAEEISSSCRLNNFSIFHNLDHKQMIRVFYKIHKYNIIVFYKIQHNRFASGPTYGLRHYSLHSNRFQFIENIMDIGWLGEILQTVATT